MTPLFIGTQLVSVADDKPVRLVIEGFASENEQLFLNEISGEIQPNYQLLYAIGPGRYLDDFGQRLGPFVITGLHIMTSCASEQRTQAKPAFLTFYEKNNIVTRAKRGEGPLRITFNGVVLSSYLTKLVFGSYQKEGTDGQQFQLHILTQLSDSATNEQQAAAQPAAGAFAGFVATGV